MRFQRPANGAPAGLDRSISVVGARYRSAMVCATEAAAQSHGARRAPRHIAAGWIKLLRKPGAAPNPWKRARTSDPGRGR